MCLPVPIVVTSTLHNGSPGSAYPMNHVGVVATDPILSQYGNRMKAAFVQFLWLRHGGSGFVFGYGDPSVAVAQNFAYQLPLANPNPNAPIAPSGIPPDRPFHSLSYPDINFTVIYRWQPLCRRRPIQTPCWPPRQARDLPPTYTGGYTGDPGVRNPILYPALATRATPGSSTGSRCSCPRPFRSAGSSSRPTRAPRRPLPRAMPGSSATPT